MEFTSPHKCIKNASTNGILTKHLLNTSGRSWTPKRTRKFPMQLGRIKERKKRKKRGNGKGPAPPGGELKVRRGSCNSKKHPPSRESHWDRRGPFVIRGEHNNWSVDGRTKNCAHGPCCSPAHPSLSCVSPGTEQGWELESGVWRADPGRGQLLL